MTYDYHTGGKIAHFNAPLFAAENDPTPGLNADASIRAFLDGGVPANKLLVGVPFYARVYGNVPNVNRGLFQSAGAAPAGWKEADGNWDVLARTRLKDPRFVRYWDAKARVPYLFDATAGTWITYDDPESVAAKARYVRERRLGGVVIWQIGADDGALLGAIAKQLSSPRN
jgi:chitinase